MSGLLLSRWRPFLLLPEEEIPVAASDYWHDKRVLVTGGSSGLGLALAQEFAAQGARVALLARNPKRLQQAAATLAGGPERTLLLPADITQADQVTAALETLREQWQGLEVLVNCAGRSARGAIQQQTPQQFHALMELNFYALVRCTQAALPLLLASRGHVINIGSLASKLAPRFMGAYPASKFAVAAYSQQLRLELGEQGLHVLLVCPGPIAREKTRTYQAQDDPSLPPEAGRPGAGARVKQLDPHKLARQILRACQKRRVELVVPGKVRLLLALSALWPTLGDRLLLRFTSG